MPLPLFVVDAFADRPFSGNPAAICLLDGERPDAWLQAVAVEMNLSETAYPLRTPRGWQLRWFTPAAEVDLCGHATLAAAHALWQAGRCPPGEPITFHTRSGPLTATPDGDRIALDFPALPVTPCDPVPGLADALGAELVAVGRSPIDVVCEVADGRTLRGLRPDFGRLAGVPTRGVIVTSKPDVSGYDFLSRAFFPLLGVNEDPVCGSAHCALGPYWSARLGRDDLVAYQVSPRGGEVRVGVRGDRVRLAGRAVTTLRGELLA